jgi:hypothetical protein
VSDGDTRVAAFLDGTVNNRITTLERRMAELEAARQ